MEPLTAEQLLQSIWAALRRIEDNMALPPAPLELPPIEITPPDLAEIVTAVNGLKPGPNAEEIAAAIAAVLTPTPNRDPVLEKVVEALSKLDFRMQAQQNFGGGQVTLGPGELTPVIDALAGISTYEARLDYDGRTDNQPVYVGHAANGTATTHPSWSVERVTYDGTDRPIRKQVLTGAWDERTTLGW